MGADQATELLNRLPWTSMTIAGPVMVAALVVGLLAAALAPPRWGPG